MNKYKTASVIEKFTYLSYTIDEEKGTHCIFIATKNTFAVE